MPDHSAESTPRRLVGLDALRGAAILLVLLHHPAVSPSEAGWLGPFAAAAHRFGWAGVDLFFVLSGFLIGGLLFGEIKRTGSIDVRRFLVRRGFKIWPSYYAYLAVAAAVLAWRHPAPGLGTSLVPNLLNGQNYFGTPFQHTWSLAVEEHFYFLLPLLLLLAPRRKDEAGEVVAIAAVPWISLFLMVGCTAWRCISNGSRTFTAPTHLMPTHLRIDGMFLGVLLAYLAAFRPAVLDRLTARRGWLATLGVLLIAPMAVLDRDVDPIVPTIGYTALYLGFGCLLLALAHRPTTTTTTTAGPASRTLAMIGFSSYSIYLWHPTVVLPLVGGPFSRLVERMGLGVEARWIVVTFVYIIAATAVGFVMGRLIEQPFLKARDSLFPRSSRRVGIAHQLVE